jgi:hypothetical protein
MDPFTIVGTAAAALKTLKEVSTAVYSFVDGALRVDHSIQSFLNELDSLKHVIIAIQSCLHNPDLGRHGYDHLQELFALLGGSLNNCETSLKEFEGVLASIKGNQSDHSSFRQAMMKIKPFRQSTIKIKLDMSASDIVMHRRQVLIHTSSMQVILGSINLCVFKITYKE